MDKLWQQKAQLYKLKMNIEFQTQHGLQKNQFKSVPTDLFNYS